MAGRFGASARCEKENGRRLPGCPPFCLKERADQSSENPPVHVNFIARENGGILSRVPQRPVEVYLDAGNIGVGKPDFMAGELCEITGGLDGRRYRRLANINFRAGMVDFSTDVINTALRRNSNRKADVILGDIKLLNITLQLTGRFAGGADWSNERKRDGTVIGDQKGLPCAPNRAGVRVTAGGA